MYSFSTSAARVLPLINSVSFSNLNQKNEACSAFYELEVKYKNSPKNVLQRSQEERKKLNCPEE